MLTMYYNDSTLEGLFNELKHRCPDLYRKALADAHVKKYGYHFSDMLAKEAVSMMHNVDGSKGEHWSKEDTDSLAKDIEHKADFYYLMNMFYSDYQGVLGNSPDLYAKMARAAMNDPDAPEGKWLMNFIWTA